MVWWIVVQILIFVDEKSFFLHFIGFTYAYINVNKTQFRNKAGKNTAKMGLFNKYIEKEKIRNIMLGHGILAMEMGCV